MYSLKKKVEGIILSGGYSERMGYPKSLLEWDKKTLLEYQINSLITGGCDGGLVITGKHHKEITKGINLNNKSKIIFNENYHEGKSTSIKKGIENLSKDIYSFIILAVDQPRPSWVISKMLRSHIYFDSLISSPVSNNHGGHPLIFNHKLIEEIKNIDEKTLGLRKIFLNNKNEIKKVKFNSNIVNIDINDRKNYLYALSYFRNIST